MDSSPTKCPRCASTEVKPIVETNYGWYWRCDACGEIWHQDTRPRPKLFEKRTAELLDAVCDFYGFRPVRANAANAA
jgi:ribosomal protein L37AE/L43A